MRDGRETSAAVRFVTRPATRWPNILLASCLQHRVQESAGIAAADQRRGTSSRARAGAGQPGVQRRKDHPHPRRRTRDRPRGYSKNRNPPSSLLFPGLHAWENSQAPVSVRRATNGSRREIALGPQRKPHQRAREAKPTCSSGGVTLSSTSTTEIIAAMIADDHGPGRSRIADRPRCCRGCAGPFSIVAMTRIASWRSATRHGMRPLSIGVNGRAEPRRGQPQYCVASEIRRVRHHRGPLPARCTSRRMRDDRRGRPAEQHVVGGVSGAPYCVFAVHLLRPPRLAHERQVMQVARGKRGEDLWREGDPSRRPRDRRPDSGNARPRAGARGGPAPGRRLRQDATSPGPSSNRVRSCASIACG